MTQPFWKMKTLSQLSKPEWESLCDGCGKCCLIQLEDEDSGMRLHTDVTCRLFNADTCRCGDYTNRKKRVPDCVILDPVNVTQLDWMPRTCAYRLIAEGKDLYDWHPLVSGDPMSVHNAGMSIRNQVVSEDDVTEAEWEDRIVEWPGEGDDDEDDDGDEDLAEEA